MPGTLDWLLTNALYATVLAACVAGLARRQIRPTVVHALYVVVLLRLLMPPLFGVPIPAIRASRMAEIFTPRADVERHSAPARTSELGNRQDKLPLSPQRASGSDELAPVLSLPPEVPRAADQTATVDQTASQLPRATAPVSPAGTVAVPSPAGALQPATASKRSASRKPPVQKLALSWPSRADGVRFLYLLWMIGCGVWLVVSSVRIARMHRTIVRSKVAPDWVQSIAARLAAQFQLRRCPPVVVASGPMSPAVWPFGPYVVMPQVLLERMTQEELTPLVAHELVHLRRRDHWVRLLELVVTAVYWWLPTVWWVRRRLRHVEEACCDAWVVQSWPQTAATYARSIIAAIELTARPPCRAAIHPATGIGDMRTIRGRLREIMLAQTPHRTTRFGWLMIGAAALVCCAITPKLTVDAGSPQAIKRDDTIFKSSARLSPWRFDRLPPGCNVLYKVLSPDASMVAWVGSSVSDEGTNQQGLFVIDLRTGEIRQLLDQALKTSPAWSPDSSQLAIGNTPGYAADYPLVLIDVQTGRLEQTGATGVGAAWSPDSEEIAVSTEIQRGGSWSAGVPTDGRIGIWNIEQRQMRFVTPPAFHISIPGAGVARAGAVHPVWSPDGNWIAFELLVHIRNEDEETSRHELWAVRRDAGEMRRVLERFQPYRWSEDGKSIFLHEGERTVSLDRAPVVTAADWPQPDAELLQAVAATQERLARARQFDTAAIFTRNRPWQNPNVEHLKSVEFTHRMSPVRLDERFSWRADGACSVEVVYREDQHAQEEIGRIWLLTPSGQQLTLGAAARYPRQQELSPDQVRQETLGHLMGTRMNCVAQDWARHPDWFVLSDVRPAQDAGQQVLELKPRLTRQRRRYYLNVGALFHTTSWSYVHHLTVSRTELIVDEQTGRIVKEIDYTSDQRPTVFEFRDWLDVGDGQSVPQAIHVQVPDHAFHCEYRFQWLPDRLWLLESGKSWFDGKDPQLEAIVDLKVNGEDPVVDRHLRDLQQRLKMLDAEPSVIGHTLPIRTIPFTLGRAVPLEWAPASSPAAKVHQWEFTVDAGGQRFREMGVRPTVRAEIALEKGADQPPTAEPMQLVLYDQQGQPVHAFSIPLGAIDLLERPAAEFLARIAGCSSMWIHPDPDTLPNVTYSFHDGEGSESTYATTDASNPHFVRGVTMTLALDALLGHSELYRMPVVFQADLDGRPVEVAIITGPSFGAVFGNGIQHSWRGYSVSTSTSCVLVVDQQTGRPLLERFGNTEVRFLDYVEPQSGQYVPRRIVVQGEGRPAYDFRFQVLDGRVWLFDRSYSAEGQRVVYVDAVQIDGRQPSDMSANGDPAAAPTGGFDWAKLEQRQLLADADHPLARQIASSVRPFARRDFELFTRMRLTDQKSVEIDLGRSPFWRLVRSWSLSHAGQEDVAVASSDSMHSMQASGAVPIEWDQVLRIQVSARQIGQAAGDDAQSPWLRTIRLDRHDDRRVTGTVELVSRQHFTEQLTVISAVLLDERGLPLASAESSQTLRITEDISSADVVLDFGILPAGVEASHVRIGLASTTIGILRSTWATFVNRSPVFSIEQLLSSESRQVQRVGLQELYRLIEDSIQYEGESRDSDQVQQVVQEIAPYTRRLEELLAGDQEPAAVAIACRLAGHSGRQQFVPRLAELLDHSHGDIQDAAAIGLGLLGDDRGVDRVRGVYERLKDSAERSPAEDRLFTESQIVLGTLGKLPPS